jgi:hypothetical protein
VWSKGIVGSETLWIQVVVADVDRIISRYATGLPVNAQFVIEAGYGLWEMSPRAWLCGERVMEWIWSRGLWLVGGLTWVGRLPSPWFLPICCGGTLAMVIVVLLIPWLVQPRCQLLYNGYLEE